MARSIATNTTVEREQLLDFVRPRHKMLVATAHTPVGTNPKTRESRLFPSMSAYVRRNGIAILRIYSL